MISKVILANEGNLALCIDKLNIKKSNVAIVGGHYSLFYERNSASLKPAIQQELTDVSDLTFAKLLSQNFPVRSFELTVRLYFHFMYNKITSRCVLIVNDEAFLNKDFRNSEDYDIVKDSAFKLRKDYFSTSSNIPQIFKGILFGHQLKYHDFFEFFESKDEGEDNLLPKSTLFISERKLCKSFKKTVKKTKPTDNLFSVLKINHENSDSVEDARVGHGTGNEICVIDKGVCSCGGKAFQLYYELIEKGYDTIIFFVPDECISHVNQGTELLCNSDYFRSNKIDIINITFMSDIMFDNSVNNEIMINYYSNS